MATLSCPPNMPSILEGFLNLRGSAVPVVSVSRLFQLPERSPELYTPIIVVKKSGSPLAFLVDYVSQIRSVAIEDRLPLQRDDSFNGCTEAESTIDGRTVQILSPERLLIEKERQCLSEFQSMEQQRLRDLEVRQL